MANMKCCELCSSTATMFCESDQARLCWDCDGKVHAANFLVAKHTRTLLCNVCYSHTPWKAAGPKLGPTVSVCHDCARRPESREENIDGIRNEEESYDSQECEHEYDEEEDYSDSDGDGDSCEDGEEEEEGENQVVPWSQQSLAASISSTSFPSSKRPREEDFESEDEDGCCSSKTLDFKDSDENSDCPLRASKMPRFTVPPAAATERFPAKSSTGTLAIFEKLRRFQQERRREEGEESDRVVSLCKLSNE